MMGQKGMTAMGFPTDKTLPVTHTNLARYFQFEEAEEISILSHQEARGIFSDYLLPNARHLYDIRDKDWWDWYSVSSQNTVIANWNELDSVEGCSKFSDILQTSTNWPKSAKIFYIMGNTHILVCTWRCFTEHWRAFCRYNGEDIIIVCPDHRGVYLDFDEFGCVRLIIPQTPYYINSNKQYSE